jgi:outer membrane protein assembly factor BamB
MRTILIITVLFWLFSVAALAAEPDNTWPQWRGPTRDGKVSATAAPWPARIGEDQLKLAWRNADLAESYASPIVSDDRVFTVETRDKKTEIVRALDRTTGKQVWEHSWEGSLSVPFFAAANGSWVRATPALDEGRLYVGGIRDVLVCLDAKAGKEVWRVDFTERFKAPAPTFGFVSSPLIVGEAVYVQAGAAFVKLNKATGETIWRTLADEGGMNGSAFASPVMATLQGKPQLLVQTRQVLAGVSPDNGSVLWQQKIETFQGMNILTPTAYDNTVFTSAYGGRTLQLKIEAAGGALTARQAWENRTQGYMCSPVVINDHVYLLGRNKRFTCISLATGETKWTTDKTYSEYWSLVAQGDRILALDQRGILLLIHANPEKFELIDERKISEQDTWAHLVVVGDEIFIRERKAMAAYKWK